jgi:hypothetical protein
MKLLKPLICKPIDEKRAKEFTSSRTFEGKLTGGNAEPLNTLAPAHL